MKKLMHEIAVTVLFIENHFSQHKRIARKLRQAQKIAENNRFQIAANNFNRWASDFENFDA